MSPRSIFCFYYSTGYKKNSRTKRLFFWKEAASVCFVKDLGVQFCVPLGDVVLHSGQMNMKPDEFAAFLRSGALNAAPTATPYHKQEDAADET